MIFYLFIEILNKQWRGLKTSTSLGSRHIPIYPTISIHSLVCYSAGAGDIRNHIIADMYSLSLSPQTKHK